MNYANFTRFSPEYVIPFNSFQSDSCNDSSSVVRQNGEPQNGCAYIYQGVRNVRFSENLACFVFLKHPFWDSPYCLITDVLAAFYSQLKGCFVSFMYFANCGLDLNFGFSIYSKIGSNNSQREMSFKKDWKIYHVGLSLQVNIENYKERTLFIMYKGSS